MKLLILVCAAMLTLTGQNKKLTIADVMYANPDFRTSTVRGIQWTPDGSGYVYLDRSGTTITFYDVKTGKTEVYIDGKDNILEAPRREKRFTLANFQWSPADSDILLVPKGSDLYIYNRKRKKLDRLTNDDKIERDPTFSPDGKKIAYLKDHNLVVLDIATKSEKQVTNQGTDKILVGRFDWVYEEEFGIRTGFFWAPSSERIAYMEVTDANTPRFPIVDFIPTQNTVEYLPYPKAGAPNSTVKIGVVDLDAGTNSYMDVSSTADELIPRIKWTPDDDNLIIWKMNRDQDKLDLYLTDVEDKKSKVILSESQPDGWIDIHDDVIFLEDEFVWISRKDGFNHLYLYEYDGTMRRQLTSGQWEVSAVNGYHEDREIIYFTAAKKSPLQRELYGVSVDGGRIRNVSTSDGYHRINMDPTATYFLDYHSSLTTAPSVDLKQTSNGSTIRNLRNNDDVLKKIQSTYAMGQVELIQVPTEDGVQLNGYMIKPPSFDSTKKYPVLMFQYSGPGSQSVRDSYMYSSGGRGLWHFMLAQNDIIVVCVDPRGTGYRGRAFEQITNHNLGDYESRDLRDAARWLRKQTFVDGTKIGIWGWSYGGYMSSLAMMRFPTDFNLAIAVAPVTSWKNYDTIYTERFMSTPAKNPNYDKGAPMHYAHQLTDANKFLLIHGTGDDNVHLSNSVQLVEVLVRERKQFEMFCYPRSQHGMVYDFMNTQTHLYTMMTNFIMKHFK